MSAALSAARGRISFVAGLPFVLLAVLVVLDVSLQPALLSRDQIGLEVATAMSLILVGLGQTVVILTRGIDLSVGGMMSMTNCLLATQVGSSTGSLLLWCVVIMLVGIAGGAVNGLLIGLTRLQPFVVTLATWSIFNGIALWILPSPGGDVPSALISFPLGDWAGIPRMLWLLALICLLWSLLRRTRTGTQVYAFGSDPDASFLSGVSTLGVTLRVYAFSGLCAALAGIFVATQTASGSPTVGSPFILNAVAAVVIGGTSLFGGRGGFAGTVAGAFVLTIIAEVTFGLGINSNWGVFAQGLLLILAVGINSTSEIVQRRKEERR
jgi:ribose transport system permease protein